MSDGWGSLIPREKLLALVDRSIERLSEPPAREDSVIGESHHVTHMRAEAELGALASSIPMAIAVLGADGDPAMLDYVVQSYEHTVVYDERWLEDASALGLAIEHIVAARGESALEHAETIVTKGPTEARLALVKGLAPHAAESEPVRAMLARLHQSGEDTVRGAASKALGGHAPPPWAGIFPSDPLAALPPDRARALRAPLTRVLALVGAPYYQIARSERALRRAMKALPDALAIPLATRLLLREHFFDVPLFERWARATCAEDLAHDAPTRLETLIAARGILGPQLGAAIVSAFVDAAPELRAGVARRLMKALPGPGQHASLVNLPLVVAALLPDDVASEAILAELASTLADEARGGKTGVMSRSTSLVQLLRARLSHAADLGSLLEPALAAFSQGWPAPWSSVRDVVTSALLASDDPRVRRFAESGMGSDDDGRALFSLRYLMRVAGPRGGAALLRSALSSPRIRALVAGDAALGARALAGLRTALRAGALEAAEVADVVGRVADAKRTLSPKEHARAMAAAEALAKTDRSALASLVVELARLGAIEPSHALVARLEASWREGEAEGDGVAYVLIRLAMGVGARDEWRPLVERIAGEHPNPRMRALAALFVPGADDSEET